MNLFEEIIDIFYYSQECLALPIGIFECVDFWIYCFVAILVFCLFVITFLAYKIFKYRAFMAGYKKMLLARSVIADDVTMGKYKVQSALDADHIDQDDLASQIRQKIKQGSKNN